MEYAINNHSLFYCKILLMAISYLKVWNVKKQSPQYSFEVIFSFCRSI
jgi:hypothetical protein